MALAQYQDVAITGYPTGTPSTSKMQKGLASIAAPQQPQFRTGTISDFFGSYLTPEMRKHVEGLRPNELVDLIADNPGFFGASNDDYKFYSKGVLEDGRRGTILNPVVGTDVGYYKRDNTYHRDGKTWAGDDIASQNIYARQFSPDFTSRSYTIWADPNTGGLGIRRYGGGPSGWTKAWRGLTKDPLKTAALAAAGWAAAPYISAGAAKLGAAAGIGTGAGAGAGAGSSGFWGTLKGVASKGAGAVKNAWSGLTGGTAGTTGAAGAAGAGAAGAGLSMGTKAAIVAGGAVLGGVVGPKLAGVAGVGGGGMPGPSNREEALLDEQIALARQTAEISREQWNLWKQHGLPAMQNVAKKVDNWASPGRIKHAQGRATEDVNAAYDRERSSLRGMLGRYGMNPGSGRFASALRQLSMGRAANVAGARNDVSTEIMNRDLANRMSLAGMWQGLPGQTISGLNSATSGLGAITGNMARERIAAAQADAQEKAALWGGLGQIGGGLAAGWMMSDIRMKTNIEEVGILPTGIRVYEFSFGDDLKNRYTGVMAQEVYKVSPERVGRRGDYLTVDYPGVIRDAEKHLKEAA